jgi:hypothetical protein
VRGEREVPVELITGFYETSLEPDELLVEVVVPGGAHRAAYRKFARARTRTGPQWGSGLPASGRAGRRRRGRRHPQWFPELCDPHARRAGRARLRRRSTRSRTSAVRRYRRRVIEVEVRRALEEVA